MRILICGASGMIGHKLWPILSAHNKDVLGTFHGKRGSFARYALCDAGNTEEFEAADFNGVTQTLDRLHPDVIINCIGITKRKVEANVLEKMFMVNARFPHHLALW